MNNERWDTLLKIAIRIGGIYEELAALRDEEQAYVDTIPEGERLRRSSRYVRATNAIGVMERAMSRLIITRAELKEVAE